MSNQLPDCDHGTRAPSLPDINAGRERFDTVQHLLDEAAYINLFSIPDRRSRTITHDAAGGPDGVVGFGIHETLHRFEIATRLPDSDAGLRATNVIGEKLASFEQRWMIIPDDFGALPGREPPATLFNPAQTQRFVMLDGICTFAGSRDGFHGFGTGTTYPVLVNGQPQLHVAAVGSIVEGFGRFKDHDGTYTYCGSLSPHDGFTGNLLCRIVDPDGAFYTDNSLPALQPWPNPEPEFTYLMLRGQKKDKNQKTAYNFDPNGQVVGINVTQQLRQVFVEATTRDHRGLCSTRNIGPVIGKMSAQILFNFFSPEAAGTPLAPIPFQSYNEYTILDRRGGLIGSISADGRQGRTFRMALSGAPQQVALRFGGYGRIVKGTGDFREIAGLMVDNSVVALAPSAISTLYVLRIHDPEGKYRGAGPRKTDACTRERERLIDACRR